MKHITDSERLLQASYHKKEAELKELKAKLEEYKEQLETMVNYITELKALNKVLCKQIHDLHHNHNCHV